MGKEYTVDIDSFARTLEDIFKEVDLDIQRASKATVEKVCKDGAKKVNQAAGSTFKGKKYQKSWTYKTKGNKCLSEGEIGSRIPGLPHLLEKGHATIGGGRVPGRNHISRSAEEIFRDFEEKIEEELEKAIGT